MGTYGHDLSTQSARIRAAKFLATPFDEHGELERKKGDKGWRESLRFSRKKAEMLSKFKLNTQQDRVNSLKFAAN